MTGDQWAAAQSAPLSALQSGDPTKATTNGFGRPLTGDEYEQAQRMSANQVSSWKIPALPIPSSPRDVTRTPADTNTKGKPIEAPLEGLQFVPGMEGVYAAGKVAGAMTRQLVNPVLEHPFMSAPLLPFALPAVAAAAPVAAVGAAAVTGIPAAYNVARYGWTKAHELTMSPEERAKSEADPDRVSGEAAAVQAAMLGLAPLIHVATRSVVGPPRYLDSPTAARDVMAPQRAAAVARGEFAAMLERGAAETPADVRAPKGFEPTAADVRAGRVKSVEGLIAPEAARAGRVTPLETQPASAPLQEAADINAARRAYEVQRVSEDTQDIAAARTADAERLLGLRDEEQQPLTVRRRPGGAKAEPAPFFESPQGAETLGAMAARHGLPEDANPYHPESPLAPEWQAGHDNATQSYPVFPEGFTMGGAESRIPADFTAPHPQGFEPTSAPPGATPETAQLAAALRPSRFRGHSTDELVRVTQSARETIDRAQRVIDSAPEGAAPIAAERAVTRANSTLAQTEREFALRGVTGDKLAQLINPETGPTGTLTEIEGTGATRTRGLAAGIEEKAIANKLDVAFGDLPEYRVMSIADQAQKAAALLRDDPELARDIATGRALPPRGSDLHPESVLVAVENKAIAEGDVNTLRELATGKLTTAATEMGRRIRLLGERDTDSPVAAIQEVVNKRSGGAEKAARATEAEVTRIRSQIAGASIEKGAWTEFVNSLKC